MAGEDDEERAKRISQIVIGEDLSELSVDELTERIDTLKQEIARIETAMGAKQSHLSAAEALFSKS